MYNELTRQELAQEAWRIKRQDLADAAMWIEIYRRRLDKTVHHRPYYEHLLERNCKTWRRLIREIVEIEEQLK